jgi:1-deoxy-D-xylulose-5-phosphate reductoisomerase
MKIPLINSLNFDENFKIKTSQLNLNLLNNLDFNYVDKKKFPLIEILNNLPENLSLFETILVSLNDKLVELFLKKKITYFDLCKKLLKTTKLKSFKRFKKIQPKTIDEIINLSKYINTNFEKLMYKK